MRTGWSFCKHLQPGFGTVRQILEEAVETGSFRSGVRRGQWEKCGTAM